MTPVVRRHGVEGEYGKNRAHRSTETEIERPLTTLELDQRSPRKPLRLSDWNVKFESFHATRGMMTTVIKR